MTTTSPMIPKCLKEVGSINEQYLEDLKFLVTEMKWGKLNVELVIHDSKVSAINIISQQRVDYTKGAKVEQVKRQTP